MVMTPEEQRMMGNAQASQPRGGLLGLFDKAMKTDDNTGLSPLQNFAAALDPLIMKDMRAGQNIRQQGAQRATSISKNKTVETLKKQGREDLAQLLLDGGINAGQAISMMQSEKASDTAFQRQKDLAAFNAGLTAPKDTRTAQIKNYEYFLAQGKTPDEAAALAKTGDVFNLGGKSDFQTALMKKQADQYVKYTDDASAASDALNNLSIMKQLSAGDTFYSGIGAETLLEAKKAVVALGGNPDAVSDAESFNAIAKKTALDIMGGSLGVGFSNADRDFVEGMVPKLTNTKEGNRQIIDIQEKIQQRRIDLSILVEDYASANGNITGLKKYLREWSKENPLFPQSVQPSALSSNANSTIVNGYTIVPKN